MLLQHKLTGSMIEVLCLSDLFNPSVPEFLGSDQCGEETQYPDNFSKSEMLFPSGEPLPRCWLNDDYHEI